MIDIEKTIKKIEYYKQVSVELEELKGYQNSFVNGNYIDVEFNSSYPSPKYKSLQLSNDDDKIYPKGAVKYFFEQDCRDIFHTVLVIISKRIKEREEILRQVIIAKEEI